MSDRGRQSVFTLSLGPDYSGVRARIESALRQLPPRKSGAPRHPLDQWAHHLACQVLSPDDPPEGENKPNRRKAAAQAASFKKAWGLLPVDVRSRVTSGIAIELRSGGVKVHPLAVNTAITAVAERVVKDLSKPDHPTTRSRERSLATALATVYWDLTGRHPSTSNRSPTPFCRLVEQIFPIAGLNNAMRHARWAADRCRATLPASVPGICRFS